MIAAPTRRFTVDEYYRMSELGILTHTERTELLNGEIFQLVAHGKAHAVAIRRTGSLFTVGLAGRFETQIQLPVTLNEYSEPQPDIAITIPDPHDFLTHHPSPEEILLLIEVADSSLQHDLETKASAYSVAGIAEYWVLDVNERNLFVLRQPTPAGYRSTVTYTDADTVIPLRFEDFFEDFKVRVADMLPPIVN